VVAINGAPLGLVTDPGVLARKVAPLRRPIRITFEKTPMIPNELNDDRIRDIFNQFDADGSGDLDTFELFHAVEEMTGHSPSTVLIGAMVEFAGAAETNNVLKLDQFVKLVRQFDWEAEEHLAGLPEGLYEVTFPDKSLGFSVQEVPGKGMIAVSKIGTLALKGQLSLGDTVLAINGAPLGFVTDPKVLGQKVGPLRRPLRITFEKMKPPNPADFSEERIADIFSQFDADGSGDLDTFELYHAIAEVLGRAPSSAVIGAMVTFSGAANNVLSLAQFSTLVHAFNWDDPALKEGLPKGHFEVVFKGQGLGFAVASVKEKGTMIVSRIGDQHLQKVLSLGDTVVAINGAPLGYVTDPTALAKKVKPLRRPVRITFEKVAEGGILPKIDSSLG
jgi:Ca2+-binding EF-hand superfamily protein